MITRVRTVTVPVRDQARAKEFYADKLGFQVHRDEPTGMTQNWLEVSPPGAETRLVLFTPPGTENRIGTFQGLVFHCDDVEKTARELAERGVEISAQPKEEPWGKWAQFKDPDGNEFGLIDRTD